MNGSVESWGLGRKDPTSIEKQYDFANAVKQMLMDELGVPREGHTTLYDAGYNRAMRNLAPEYKFLADPEYQMGYDDGKGDRSAR